LVADEVIEERSFVVSFADAASDSCGFKIGVDWLVDFDEIAILLQGFDECSEIEMGHDIMDNKRW
jgi:hypothetical protein